MTSQPQRGLLGSLSSFREGAGLLFEGAGFLRRERSLWALALVPVFFALLLTTLGLALFVNQFDALTHWITGLFPVLEPSAWWTWLWVGPGRAMFFLVRWLAVLIALAMTVVAGLLFANLLSAPFLDRLSERVEHLVVGGEIDGSKVEASVLRQALKSFGSEAQRIFFLVGIGVSLSLAGFLIPGGQLLTGPAILFLTVSFLPLDYAGFALDRRGASFRERRDWLRLHRPLMLGFGGVAFAACLVPGLNLLLMPALVTGGTLLVCRREPDREDSIGVRRTLG